jgi:hypothetical protein
MKAFLKNHIFTIVLVLLLSIPLTLQTFQPGFFVGDDGEWMIIRSSAFHEALRDGQIPVRYLGRLNHEYGYPVATFLYPGYLYLTEPLVFAHLGFINSIKIMFTLSMVFSGLFAYLWLSSLFKKWPAFIGALVYLYTPYHLVDMYSRGSLGELLALAVVPFILWNIERRSLFFSAIGIGGLILSHNIMAALFLPCVLLYAFLRNKKSIKNNIISVAVLTVFGAGLAAFFWMPALLELQYTIFNQTKISEWQNYFAPFSRIGGLQLIIILFSVLLFVFKKWLTAKKSFIETKLHKSLIIFFTIAGLLSVFFSSSFSSPLWYVLPVTFIQFPFRFLSLEVVAVAFLAAFILDAIQNKMFQRIYGAVIIIALAINAVPYLTHIPSFDKGEGFYTTNQSTTTTRDEYMPVWVKEKPFDRPAEKVQIINGEGSISNNIVTNKRIAFAVNAKTDVIVQINKIYWPGWNASIDGSNVSISHSNSKGLMTLPIAKGTHKITLLFQETPLRLFADIVSIISFISLAAVAFLRGKKQQQKLYNKKR